MASHAHAANRAMLDDGFDGMDGHLEIPVDDYGSYGRLFPSSVFDWFQPAADMPDYPSYMAGAFMFVDAAGKTSSVLLSEYQMWAAYLETPPNEDGLVGTHANLARTITTAISGSGASATSAFEVTSDDFTIHVDLTQTITTDLADATSVLAQVYTLHNSGTAPVDLVFHAAWEPDLYYSNGSTNTFENDVVGVVPGLCAVYVHNPGSTTQAVALSSGSGTTLATPPFYFGGKSGDMPPDGDPALKSYDAADAEQYVWLQHGFPPSWRNYVSGAGYNTAGDSTTYGDADASIGLEWRFTLAAGATEMIDVRRHYGTIAVPCNVAPTCNNGMLDPGEPCDGEDTQTCNGRTCMTSMCGDGYKNDFEECETVGVDSDTCNGLLCTTPACGDGYFNPAAEACDDGEDSPNCNKDCTLASCGDGYVNAARGEECEGGELCDPTTCTVTFSLGGGCAGCGTSSSGAGWLAGLALVLTSRRRRRARRG